MIKMCALKLLIFIVISLIFVLPSLWWGQAQRHEQLGDPGRTPQTASHTSRPRRSVPSSSVSDKCLTQYGGIELNYTLGSITTFQFDLCNVINCGKSQSAWRGYDVYMCDSHFGDPTVEPAKGWCNHWGGVLWGSAPHYVSGGYVQPRPFSARTSALQRGGSLWRQQDHTGRNPLHLTLKDITENPYNKVTNHCKFTDHSVYFVFGVDQTGADTMGLIKINFLSNPSTMQTAKPDTPRNITRVQINQKGEVANTQTSPMTPTQVLSIATGYIDKNTWLEWMSATVASLNMTDCIACSSARPTLFTVPAPLFPESDPTGFQCMLKLTMTASPSGCETLNQIFPPVHDNIIPPVFSPRKGNYTFFRKSGWPGPRCHRLRLVFTHHQYCLMGK